MNFLKNLLFNLFKIILSRPTKNKFQLCLFWIKIKLASLFLNSKELKTVLFLGYQIHFYSYSALSYLVEEIFINHIYKFEAPPKDHFKILDAGANIGLSILYFKIYYPECSITAFEADPKTFAVLEKNIQLNRFDRVVLVNKALWHEVTQLKFYLSDTTDAALNQGLFLKQGREITVQTDLLSNYIDADIDFLKMDVEGAEVQVIEDLITQDKLKYLRQGTIEAHLHHGEIKTLKRLLEMIPEKEYFMKVGTYQLVDREFEQNQDCMIYLKRKRA